MKSLVIGTLLALTGCAGAQGVLDRAVKEGAEVADNLLSDAELYICRASTVGAVTRRYFSDAEKSKAWQRLCIGDGTITVPSPD